MVAVIAAAGIVAIADRGFFSPDVQQQSIGNLLLAWLLITGIAAMLPAKSRIIHPTFEHQEAST